MPTVTVCTTSLVAGSTRETLFVARELAHNEPAPNASSVAGVWSGAAARPFTAAILEIVSSLVFATHTE